MLAPRDTPTRERKSLDGLWRFMADPDGCGREQRWFDILSYLMEEEPADLTAVLFDGVDKIQHLCWRFLDPACRGAEPSSWERTIVELCEGYFRQIDGIIARIVERAGPEDVRYTSSRDEAEAAFLVRPASVADVFERARRGEVLPQKTTYFAPKLLSGLLFHPLD